MAKNRYDVTERAVHIGVDDWAWRKGERYGAIIVDLDCHRPLALLPDRQASTLATWLQAHPSIAVISRDRSSAFAEGATAGAPTALQVADRFHLLANVREAVLQTFIGQRARIDAVLSQPVVPETPVVPDPSPPLAPTTPLPAQPIAAQVRQRRTEVSARRQQRFEACE